MTETRGPTTADQGTDARPAQRRGLRDAILYPSPVGLLVSLVILVVPLLWPVTLYMWLRSVTGHRAPAGQNAKLQLVAAAVLLLVVVLALEAIISRL